MYASTFFLSKKDAKLPTCIWKRADAYTNTLKKPNIVRVSYVIATVEQLATTLKNHLILDVRSPGEYMHAHIPNAINLAIFSNEERAIIGTAYKQKSREEAIKLGFDFFGKKMNQLVEQVELLQKKDNDKPIIVQCARGGMRSAAICWLLSFYGYKVQQLESGYKAYRQWCLALLEKKYDLVTIGGSTGSWKTKVLTELHKNNNINILDFEKIASHKGSAFGALGLPAQPSQEQWENYLAEKLHELGNKTIVVEDESKRIGNVNIPNTLWENMRNNRLIFLVVPFEQRLQNIMLDYGHLPIPDLVNSTKRIEKKLGGDACKAVCTHLENGEVQEGFAILLTYYDKLYHKSLHNRENLDEIITKVDCQNLSPAQIAEKIAHLC